MPDIIITDPNTSLVRSPPKDLRDVYIAANKGAVLVYNNLSSLPEWLSDALCVVTEGSSDSRRELYSNDEESIIFARAPAVLTAVTNIIAKGDLSQRALYAVLAPVADSERKDEPELWDQFESARPEILGALLTALSEGLRRLPTIRVTLPRMATFAKSVTACERAFWPEGTFLAAYGVNADNAVDDVLDADVGVATFRDFVAERNGWEGTLTQLHAELVERIRKPEREAAEKHRKAVADRDADLQVLTAAKLREAQQAVRDVMSSGWPKNPQVLSGRLKKVGPQLRKIGVAITWPAGRRQGRKISIATHSGGPRENASFASSASSKHSEQSSHDIEDSGLDENTIYPGGRTSPPEGRTSHPGGRTQEDIGSKPEDALGSPQDELRTHWEQTEARDNHLHEYENWPREDAEDAEDPIPRDLLNMPAGNISAESMNEYPVGSEHQSHPVKPPKRTMDL